VSYSSPPAIIHVIAGYAGVAPAEAGVVAVLPAPGLTRAYRIVMAHISFTGTQVVAAPGLEWAYGKLVNATLGTFAHDEFHYLHSSGVPHVYPEPGLICGVNQGVDLRAACQITARTFRVTIVYYIDERT
jgi:hypothetical protein